MMLRATFIYADFLRRRHYAAFDTPDADIRLPSYHFLPARLLSFTPRLRHDYTDSSIAYHDV